MASLTTAALFGIAVSSSQQLRQRGCEMHSRARYSVEKNSNLFRLLQSSADDFASPSPLKRFSNTVEKTCCSHSRGLITVNNIFFLCVCKRSVIVAFRSNSENSIFFLVSWTFWYHKSGLIELFIFKIRALRVLRHWKHHESITERIWLWRQIMSMMGSGDEASVLPVDKK